MSAGNSGSFELTQSYFSMQVEWEQACDVEAWASQIGVSLYLKSSSWYGRNYYLDGYVKIGGVKAIEFDSYLGTHAVYLQALNTYAKVKAADSSAVSPPWIVSGIKHGNDGRKSVEIEVNVTLYTGSTGNGNATKISGVTTVELDAISGFAYIDIDGTLQPFVVYVDNGQSLDRCFSYEDDGSTFNLCK